MGVSATPARLRPAAVVVATVFFGEGVCVRVCVSVCMQVEAAGKRDSARKEWGEGKGGRKRRGGEHTHLAACWQA